MPLLPSRKFKDVVTKGSGQHIKVTRTGRGVVDAVSIDAEQEKVTILGNKLDPNELIKELKKSGKHAEICNGNGNGNGGKKNGNGNANANSGENNGNANGGKKNGNGNAKGGENNGNRNGNGNASGGGNNGNASGGKKNGNDNVNGGENNGNGNGNASGGGNNGNGNMAQMVPIGCGGYYHQGMPMQMQPYSYEQLHHMMMMNQQQQHMNMYPSMNYMQPPPIQSRCMADLTDKFNDENVQSCRIM
ncbi:heavy metal-associated isoprenylated plant protein 32 [Medicago truncatula]|uniref:heavy metal-associated isoprenylated plant protein 32 n=1 Tax=Medicago truncatula TaxID=3880 RepID=UPI000D2F3552|nr:heavy metal-associated isoprenylated plant protein 32 [Medicago truncatula]